MEVPIKTQVVDYSESIGCHVQDGQGICLSFDGGEEWVHLSWEVWRQLESCVAGVIESRGEHRCAGSKCSDCSADDCECDCHKDRNYPRRLRRHGKRRRGQNSYGAEDSGAFLTHLRWCATCDDEKARDHEHFDPRDLY